MANIKLTELDAITTLASADVLAAVDVSADETHKITAANLFRTLPDGTAAAPSLSFASDAANGVYLAGTDTVGISTGGTQRVTVDGSGNVTISGGLTVEGQTTTVESTIVTIDDKNIELGSVASPSDTTADGGGITLKGATDKTIKWINSTGYWTFNTGIEVGGHIQLDDSNKAIFGTGGDLEILHNGANSFITNFTGDLYILNHNDDKDILLQTDNGSGGTTTYVLCDGSTGSTKLNHLGSEKLQTKSDGILVQGEVQSDSLDVNGAADITGAVTLHANLSLQDSDKILLGASSDLQIYHNGSNSLIDHDGVGALVIRQLTDDGNLALQADNGSGGVINYVQCNGSSGEVRLYHYGSEKLNTKSDGIDVTGEVQCDSLDVDGSADFTGEVNLHNNLSLQDNDKINFGGGNDLQIFHDGSNSVIRENGTGALTIQSNGGEIAVFDFANSQNMGRFVTAGAVELYHNGSKKFETKSDGIDVTGEVQCDSLDCDGSADFTGDATFRGGAAAVEIAANSDIRLISGTWTGDYGAKIQHHSNTLYIQGGSSGIIFRDPNGTDRARFDANGHFHPNGSNNYDLGTSSNQWRNAFFDGTVNADGLDVDGNANISSHIKLGDNGRIGVGGSTATPETAIKFVDSNNINIIVGNGEKARIDNSGRLMLGTTTEGDTTADNLTIADSGNCGMTVRSGTSSSGSIFFSDATSGSAEYDGYVQYQHDNRALRFATAATERLRINSNGAWAIEGASNYGTSGQVLTSNGNDAPTWQDAGAANVGGASAISMNDNVKINFGDSNDLQIYHDGTNSYIDDAGTGNLRLNGNEVHILSNDNSEYGGRFISNGAVELYHDGNKKFETKSDGVDVTGELQCDSLDVDGNADISGRVVTGGVFVGDGGDNDTSVSIGASNDLRLYHDGSNSYIKDRGTGNLKITSNGTAVQIEKSDGENMAIFRTDGSVDLYYDNSKKLNTKSDGVLVTGELECSSLDVNGVANFSGVPVFQTNVGIGNTTVGNSFANGKALAFGDNDTGIRQNGDGILEVWSNNAQMFRFRNGGNSNQSYNHLNPSANNSKDLGTSSLRWRNVYTNDLNLSNEGSANEVDGTWGSYTIQEGEDDLFLINRRNGKKYKFNLTEVS